MAIIALHNNPYRQSGAALLASSLLLLFSHGHALADEGGVSFWIPGQQGSYAALPGEPGFSFPVLYYQGASEADTNRPFQIGDNLHIGMDVDMGLLMLSPTYVFKDPVLGGQASINVVGVFGAVGVDAESSLSGPLGNITSFGRAESLTSFGDLYPTFTLKWNDGHDNFMAYLAGGIPIGDYDADDLANIGAGHGAIDAGVGYTFMDADSGWEFSAVGGATYNFENTETDYRNGVDLHLDLAASKMVSDSVQLGVAGYAYQQVSDDKGTSPLITDGFRSRTFGIGPQIGYFFPSGGGQGYVNLRGYYEFEAKNRPEGWTVFLTLSY